MEKKKIEDMVAAVKAHDFLKRREEEKKCNKLLCVLAMLGVIVTVAAVAYALYLYFAPDYSDDFEDDFDDDFDDDFCEEDSAW